MYMKAMLKVLWNLSWFFFSFCPATTIAKISTHIDSEENR